MANWLLIHQAELASYLLCASLACAAVWETFLPRRPFSMPLGTRWLHQLALSAIGSLVTRFCLPVAAVSLAVIVQQEGWGLFKHLPLPPWSTLILSVIVIDLADYAQHRMFHAVPLLWRFHQIHHSDPDVDCGTAIRHHPVETLIGQAFNLALIVVIGAPPLAVVLAITLGGVASVFNHANVAVPQSADRLMRWLVVTPDMHRIHHSADVEESNRNFANLFPWWDHLFSTYRHEPMLGQVGMGLGLGGACTPGDLTLWELLALPLRPLRVPALAGKRLAASAGASRG